MSENTQLQKRQTSAIRETAQYGIGFLLVAGVLVYSGLPVFVVFFFGVLAYVIWKTLSAPSHSGTREIFEFYLVANEILRDDERRWYGFEIQEAIGRGENILRHMTAAPPLVNFAVGALYARIGDHQAAVKNLEFVVESEGADETNFVYPSAELRNYVRTLRKIEREPADAPMMSSAVRALERARRNRARTLLEASRAALDLEAIRKAEAELEAAADGASALSPMPFIGVEYSEDAPPANGKKASRGGKKKPVNEEEPLHPVNGRQTISEVLRDIYDSKS